MSARATFGRRGGISSSRPPIAPNEASTAVANLSVAHLDLAGAARLAFRRSPAADKTFEASSAGPSRALDDEEAMRAFIGPNWGAYRRLWERRRPIPGLRSSFGWGPAAFGAVWLIYRKRYWWGFGVIAAQGAIAFSAPPLALVASLVSRLFIGRYGKSLLLIAGAAEVAARQGRSTDAQARLRELRNVGGVTLWLAVLLWLAEAWLALHQARLPGADLMDAAGLLRRVRHALP